MINKSLILYSFLFLTVMNNFSIANDYVIGAGIGLGLLSMTMDENVNQEVSSASSKFGFLTTLGDFGNNLGGELQLPIILGSGAYGWGFDDDRAQTFFLYASGAGLVTQGVTYGTKKAFARVRPADDEDSNIYYKNRNDSFYSGHSAAAFSLATVYSEVYGTSLASRSVGYGLASLTLLGRINDKRHWLSDSIIGATMGYGLTRMYINYFKRFVNKNIVLAPNLDLDRAGVLCLVLF
jgi:membrane-associated phospholipid phosphatase